MEIPRPSVSPLVPVLAGALTVALGLALASALFPVPTSAQSAALVAQPVPTSRRWPPHPKDMVGLAEVADFQASPQGEIVVFEVPQDRWLVVTNLEVQLQVGSGAFFPNTQVGVVEQVGGRTFPKLPAGTVGGERFVGGPNPNETGAWRSSGVGLTFRPGSRVVLTSTGSLRAVVTLGGYLARP